MPGQGSRFSIELQSYVTAEQHRHYARVAHEKFGVTTTPSAAAYVRDPAVFANVDADALACQMLDVHDECRQRGIRFFSQPHTLESDTIAAYLSADWTAMADHHQRCAEDRPMPLDLVQAVVAAVLGNGR